MPTVVRKRKGKRPFKIVDITKTRAGKIKTRIVGSSLTREDAEASARIRNRARRR